MTTNIINEKGVLGISDNVIANIAGLTALECFGIVGMTTNGIRAGIGNILRREHITKGIKVEREDKQLVIDFHLVIAYGVNISTVAQNLLSAVTYNIKESTSLDVKRINIYIDGVKVID